MVAHGTTEAGRKVSGGRWESLLLACGLIVGGAQVAQASALRAQEQPRRLVPAGVHLHSGTRSRRPQQRGRRREVAHASGGSRPAGCFKTGGASVPCSTHLGVWSGGNQCYAAPYNAPAGSPAWQGHSTGSLSLCSECANAGRANTCDAQVLWAAPGQAIGPPDPGRLASEALGLLRLQTAQVHTAPQAPAHTYVGVENWMWVPRAQWATLTKSVTAGATQVTVSAAPTRVLWDMGPGSRPCYGPGVPWRVGMTDAAHTNCSFTYDTTSDAEPGRRFAVSATISYDVTWVCRGACTQQSGTLGAVDAPAGTGVLTVLQRQTVVVG